VLANRLGSLTGKKPMESNAVASPAKAPLGITGKMRGAHVDLRTTDLEGTLDWYTQKLGFRVLKKWVVGDLELAFLAPATDDNFWMEVLSGGIPDTQVLPAHRMGSGCQHLCLEVDNVDATLAALRESGVRVAQEPFNAPPIGKRCGFITDLHGNVIELAANLT
jgi:lactoylglutathione lyase